MSSPVEVRRPSRSPAELALADAIARARSCWESPPKIGLADWLDKHYQPRSGEQWKTLPYQRGIADALTDPEIETVTVLKSARIGFTKLLVGYNCYRIALDPCSILIVQPAQEDAEGFSKDDLAPAFEATEPVASRIGDPKARDSFNTILHKHYPGGFVKIVGAHSGRGFRRITVDLVEFEEVDAYPLSAGSDGDQIGLGKKRAHTSAFPKYVLGSSPKLKATSRILDSWEASDQRDYIVPCPHCDHGQRLRWGGRDTDFGIKWPRGRPEEAFYLCEHCHCEIAEHHKALMVEQGRYIAARTVPGHAGFRIWAAYSPFPQAAWGVLAKEWVAAQGNPFKLQVFVNTALGEAWESTSGAPLDWEVLHARREPFPLGEDERAMVPRGAALLTCGVDVQDDRLEAQVWAHGKGEEAWVLEHQVLHGDPSSPALWDELDERVLLMPRRLERGGYDYIRATAVDTGGHHTQAAYDFCRPRFRRVMPDRRRSYVFAVKGQAGQGSIWPREASRKVAQVVLWPIRVEPAKDLIADRIRAMLKEPERAGGAGWIHWPTWLGETYFQQLTAEHCVEGYDRKGFPVRSWQPKTAGLRNEAWDTAVYAYAALRGLVDGLGVDFERECAEIETQQPFELPSEAPAAPALAAAPKSQPAKRAASRPWAAPRRDWFRR
jgi:phage terminase large subunit GpA-like protein